MSLKFLFENLGHRRAWYNSHIRGISSLAHFEEVINYIPTPRMAGSKS